MIASILARAGGRLALQSCRAALLAAALALCMPDTARAANYTDIWWNANESGWGLTLTHHNDKVFAVWYVYDENGKPLWVVMSDGVFSNDGRTFSGDVYRTSGPSYRDPGFTWSRVKVNKVGTARIDFGADDASATVTYSIGATTITKAVTRQPYGDAPANSPRTTATSGGTRTRPAGASPSTTTGTTSSASGTPTTRTSSPCGSSFRAGPSAATPSPGSSTRRPVRPTGRRSMPPTRG